jgi:hypothetical protein
MTAWTDLDPEEQCVLALADSADGSGLPEIVSGWDHWWQPDDLPEYLRTLGEAIVSLVSTGLVIVYAGMSPGDPELTIEAIRPALSNPQNWFYGDDGLEQVLWVSTTESGTRVLADAQPDDVLKYFDMRHAERRKK